MLAAAARVANGELPYRDFLWPYGPAQPYALGAWFDLFGPSLLSWRVLRVLCDAAVATTVYALVRRDAPPWLALVAWLTAACAMAQPTSPTPFPFALLLVLLAYGAATRSQDDTIPPATSSWPASDRPGGRLATRLRALRRRGDRGGARLRPGPGRPRALALFAAPAAGLALLLYLPFAAIIGPADLYDELVGKSLREKEWWTLPFPFSYDGDLRAWPPGALAKDAKDVLGFYLPLLALVGLALALLTWIPSARREWRLAGLLVLAAGMVAYLLSRADEFHTTPLIVALALVLPAIRSPGVRACSRSPARAVLGLLLLHGLANRGKALLDPPELDTIDVAVADAPRPHRRRRARSSGWSRRCSGWCRPASRSTPPRGAPIWCRSTTRACMSSPDGRTRPTRTSACSRGPASRQRSWPRSGASARARSCAGSTRSRSGASRTCAGAHRRALSRPLPRAQARRSSARASTRCSSRGADRRGPARMNDDRFATAFGRVAPAYERGRPGYPAAAIDALARNLGLDRRSVVVDLGAAPAS